MLSLSQLTDCFHVGNVQLYSNVFSVKRASLDVLSVFFNNIDPYCPSVTLIIVTPYDYKLSCPSVGWSVGWLVSPSVWQ